MLTDYTQVKNLLGIAASDTSQDASLQALTVAADAAVKRYCKRLFETGCYTWYPPQTRMGGESIVVEETPILSYRLTGNIVAGQPTVTGLTSTAALFPGMTCIQSLPTASVATQPFPNGTVIASVDLPTQVTLSTNATLTANAANLTFGLAIWCDPNGSYGDGPGFDGSQPFAANSLLQPGIDYALERNRPDGTSGSGKIIRLGGCLGLLGLTGLWSALGMGTWSARRHLSGTLPPLWSNWPPGCMKISYAAGIGTWLPAPAAVAVAVSGTGGAVASGAYQVVVTYVNTLGETCASLPTTVTAPTATSWLTIASPVATSLLTANATGWNAYVSQAGGTVCTRQNQSPAAIGAALTISTNPTSTGIAPPVVSTATSIPPDLTLAVNALAVWMRRNAGTGLMLLTSESFQGYSSAVAPAVNALQQDSELGSIRQILSRYRKFAC